MYKIVGGDQKEYGPVSAEQVRQWIAEGRANGQTLVQAEGGPWNPLSTYPEFADLMPSLPSSAPPPFSASPASAVPAPAGARQMVQGPGICLIIVGLVGACLCAVNLLSHFTGLAFGAPQSTGNPELDRLLQFFAGGFGVLLNLVTLALSGLLVAGGVRMLHLKNYGLCMAAAIIAMLPCVSPCCCLGLPVGIWALVVLVKPEVKAAFM